MSVFIYDSSDQLDFTKIISLIWTVNLLHRLGEGSCVSESLSSVFFHLLFARFCRLDHTIQMWLGLKRKANQTSALWWHWQSTLSGSLVLRTANAPEHIKTTQQLFHTMSWWKHGSTLKYKGALPKTQRERLIPGLIMLNHDCIVYKTTAMIQSGCYRPVVFCMPMMHSYISGEMHIFCIDLTQWHNQA